MSLPTVRAESIPASRQLWCERLFEAIGARRLREFAGFLTPDARFPFGSAPPVRGATAIVQSAT